MKRTIEVFTAGCPVCDPAVNLVKEIACDSCDVIVYDLIKQCEEKICLEKVKAYGIKNVPSIVVNGKLLACCSTRITKADLTNAGIDQP